MSTAKEKVVRLLDQLPGDVSLEDIRYHIYHIYVREKVELCDNCGEHYLSEEASRRILAMGEEAVKHNAEVEVRRYAA
jgi:hypothetical protein